MCTGLLIVLFASIISVVGIRKSTHWKSGLHKRVKLLGAGILYFFDRAKIHEELNLNFQLTAQLSLSG